MRDPYLRSWGQFVRWLAEVVPSERAFLEGFFLWIYTVRAHNDGTVAQIIEEVLAFPHKQPTEDLQRFQEVPEEWNARVDAFWREVAAQA